MSRKYDTTNLTTVDGEVGVGLRTKHNTGEENRFLHFPSVQTILKLLYAAKSRQAACKGQMVRTGIACGTCHPMPSGGKVSHNTLPENVLAFPVCVFFL